MNVLENEEIKELSKKYNKKKKVIKILLEECNSFGYNIKESIEIVIEFFKSVWLVQNLSNILEKYSIS